MLETKLHCALAPVPYKAGKEVMVEVRKGKSIQKGVGVGNASKT